MTSLSFQLLKPSAAADNTTYVSEHTEVSRWYGGTSASPAQVLSRCAWYRCLDGVLPTTLLPRTSLQLVTAAASAFKHDYPPYCRATITGIDSRCEKQGDCPPCPQHLAHNYDHHPAARSCNVNNSCGQHNHASVELLTALWPNQLCG